MCYSAQIWADYKKFTRQFGAILSIGDFTRIFWERREGGSPRIPKAIELAFADPRDEMEAQVKEMIDEARAAELSRITERIASQQDIVATAEAALEKRVTKKVQETIRIASNRIAAERAKSEKLQRTTPAENDDRIWPGFPTSRFANVRFGSNADISTAGTPLRTQCPLSARSGRTSTSSHHAVTISSIKFPLRSLKNTDIAARPSADVRAEGASSGAIP